MVNGTNRIVNINRGDDTSGVDTLNGLGDFIRNRREALGVTGRLLAASAEIDATMLSRIETGRMKTLPEPEVLRRLSTALLCSMTDLLEAAGYGDRTADSPPNPLVDEFVMLMNQIEWDRRSANFVRSVLVALAQEPESDD